MNTQLCTNSSHTQEAQAMLSCAIAGRIEALRWARLQALAESGSRRRTALERSVDDLLDSLSTLHRLEQLANHVAEGGYINVDADRLLIASHEETYLKLLEEAVAKQPRNAKAFSALLPSYPTPID